MQGTLSPWEIATLKVAYHGLDMHHKGYLDGEDFDRLCAGSLLHLTPQESQLLFAAADRDGNGKLSFGEFIEALQTEGGTHQAAFGALRVGLSDSELDMAAICAGGVMGLLPFFKAKLMVALGALFSDPMRMFRGSFVDVAFPFPAEAAGISQATEVGTLWRGIARLSVLRAVLWAMYAVVLDAAAGVTMFLTYAKARRYLARNESCARTLAGHPYLLEGLSGMLGGAAGGAVERPLCYMADKHVLNPFRLWALRGAAFHGTCWSVVRHSVSHACFFAGFRFSSDTLRSLAYRHFRLDQTSWSDAMVTVGAGCAAGGAYRLVSHPMNRVYSQGGALAGRPATSAREAIHSFAGFHNYNSLSMMRSGYKGLGQSLLWTMPVSGVAFLAYERMLVNI